MTRTQRWTLTVVCAATAMLMLDIAVVNTALSAIADDLDTGLSGLQWIVDAYTLPLAATVITAGSLADRFGRRRLFGIGLGIFTATSLLCAAAGSIAMLNAARAAQGIGGAVMFAVSLAVLANAFPRMEERVKALAAYGATMGGSFAVGPLVGGADAARTRPSCRPARFPRPRERATDVGFTRCLSDPTSTSRANRRMRPDASCVSTISTR
jgi:MFS family permease